MTDRDEFAARAMQGDWAAQSAETGEYATGTPRESLEKRAVLYYRMADAMLAVRDRQS